MTNTHQAAPSSNLKTAALNAGSLQHLRLLVKKRRAAEMLDMSLSTVDRWIEAGHLEKVVLGPRHVRITMASIEAMLAGAPRS